jgi:Rps23 Pro-64 3,4-dihydroxylase Tpa1-like proline 4-hydroxylase
MYKVFENVFSDININDLYSKVITTPKWSFVGNSNNSKNDYNFWYLDLSNDIFYSKNIFNRINLITGKKFKLLRCYANGQSYGQSGNFHVDSFEKDDYTFLWYINPEWNAKYGGATIFCSDIEESGNEIGNTKLYKHETFYPKPNTGLLFCSTIQHVGLEPTRYFTGLRVTIAFKLKEIMRD